MKAESWPHRLSNPFPHHVPPCSYNIQTLPTSRLLQHFSKVPAPAQHSCRDWSPSCKINALSAVIVTALKDQLGHYTYLRANAKFSLTYIFQCFVQAFNDFSTTELDCMAEQHLEMWGGNSVSAKGSCCLQFFFPWLLQILQHFSGSGNSWSAVVSSKKPKQRKEKKNWAILLTICLFPMSV